MGGVESRADLLIGVGECLNTWSNVELELANLYMIIHSVKRDDYRHPIRASFEAVISLEVRLAMLNAFIEADETISTDYLRHFKPLRTKIVKLYRKRHEVAHFSIVGRNRSSGFTLAIRPFFTWNDFIREKGAELNAAQLSERAKKFSGLADRIRHHIQHVGALRRLPPEFYVQAGDIAYPPLDVSDSSAEP